ncbi:hypothetical protein PHET_00550 [Paragonimus heterotremus]|uniref:PH domain-containing protein n=1 Tax=Paragonimus heterotremus TaxID=100268 RepID=A0A8J4SUY8_9TREM|nr:hypothetical protein PHET_00550 [Paragonimus heterotremus]
MTEKQSNYSQQANGNELPPRSEATELSVGQRMDIDDLRATLLARLCQLESLNQKLTKEKISLEHQLMHVLERLATGNYIDGSSTTRIMSREEARKFISDTIDALKIELENTAVAKKPPIAEPDYSGLRDSLIESNSQASAFEYSSLSDAYEEICLQKDLARKMITSESSHLSDKEHVVKTAKDDSEVARMVHVFRPQQPKRKSTEGFVKRSLSSRRTELGSITTKPVLTGSKEAGRTFTHSKYGDIINDRIPAPKWLFQTPQDSDLSLMNVSVKQNFYDDDSVTSSFGSCSIFSSSSSSVSSPVSPPPARFLRSDVEHMPMSLPSSPMGPTTRVGRIRNGQPIEPTTVDSIHPGKMPSGRSVMNDAHWSLNTLELSHSKPSTREELINSMRMLYGLPASTMDKTVVPLQQTVTTTGPPKIKIFRRQIKQSELVEDSSDTTSVTSRYQLPIFLKLNRSDPQRTSEMLSYNEQSNAKVWEYPIRSVDMPRRVKLQPEFAKPSRTRYPSRSQQKSHEQQTIRIGDVTDFLNGPILFGPITPRSVQALFQSNDIIILKTIAKLIQGLDAFTCTQGQTMLLQKTEPPFSTFTPILSKTDIINHSHESSDLTSELSSNAVLSSELQKNKCERSRIPPSDKDNLQPTTSTKVPSSSVSQVDTKIETPSTTISPKVCESGGPHDGILYRLSNRLKIWRRYRAELGSSSLLLYTSDTFFTHQVKRCISIANIQCIRKPYNLSSSITSGLPGSIFAEHDNQSKRRLGSVPVSRKFDRSPTDLDGRKIYGHFEIVLNSGKSHRLRGTNKQDTDLWMRHIKRVLRAVRATEILQKHRAQLVMQGWLQRIKGGEVSWVWCYLMGSFLVYTSGPDCPTSTGFTSLEGTFIRTIHNLDYSADLVSEHRKPKGTIREEENNKDEQIHMAHLLTSSSDSDTLATGDADVRSRTIAIWMDYFDPVYLICRTQHEFIQWKDNLCRACQKHSTVEESIVDRTTLQSIIRDQWHLLVRAPHMDNPYHTDECIKQPVSRTTDLSLTETCLQMFTCLLFLSYPQVECQQKSQPPFSIPVSGLIGTSEWLTMKHLVIKYLANLCFKTPELKDELFLQLIKQAMLSDAQTKRLTRRQYPQRVRRTFRALPWLCSSQRAPPSPNVRRTIRQEMEISPQVQTVEENETILYTISSNMRARLGNVARQLNKEANLVFPTTGFANSTRPECWWPLIAVWECLCLILPLFLPSASVRICLELLVRLHCDVDGSPKPGPVHSGDIHAELSRYAAFCKDALKQTLNCGGRMEVPSALEVASISIRNPYTHSYPFSIPIHLPSGNSYEVVSFNGGSELRTVIAQLTLKLGLPTCKPRSACVYAIYLRLLAENRAPRFVYLRPQWKICDVISLYEQAILTIREGDTKKVPLEEATAELMFRIQAFSWKRLKKLQMTEAKPLFSFLAQQLHADFMSGVYRVIPNGDKLLEMVAHLCRADHFDYTELQNRRETTLDQILLAYFPKEWISTIKNDGRSIIQLKLLLMDRWSWICKHPSRLEKAFMEELITNQRAVEAANEHLEIKSRMSVATVRSCFAYLRLLRSLLPERFSTASFASHISNLVGCSDTDVVWLVPQEGQINLLKLETQPAHPSADQSDQPGPTGCGLTCIKSIPYPAILSFGGQKNGSFFLVYREQTIRFKRWRKPSQREGEFYQFESPGLKRSTRPTCSHSYDPTEIPSTSRLLKKESFRAYQSRSKESEFLLNDLRIHLTDLNSVLELTDTLNYFINLR